jgi:hypothetical protein
VRSLDPLSVPAPGAIGFASIVTIVTAAAVPALTTTTRAMTAHIGTLDRNFDFNPITVEI